MARNEKKSLVAQFMAAVGNGFNRLIDFGLTAGPNVYQDSQWKQPALQHNDTPTNELIAGLDRDKVIHLNEYYKIADALSWEIGMYFISKKDTATFLMPFSSDLAMKASKGAIESWCRRDFMENRRDVYLIRTGDLLDHIAQNPLPGDDWHVRTQGKGPLFAGELKYRPLQIRKLMVVSAVVATDQRDAIAAAPADFLHRPRGGDAPIIVPPKPSGP